MEVVWQYQFRIIVVGDSTVGKSSLLKRFTDDSFNEVSDPTVGVDFYARLVEVEPGCNIKLQLWDTAGQERFRSITRSYYRNSVGGFLLFDLTNRKSFENITEWLNEINEHVFPNKTIFVLLGHKCDLTDDREVTREEVEKLAEGLGLEYLETSAKDNTNVEKAFVTLTRCIYDSMNSGEIVLEKGWDGVKRGFHPKILEHSKDKKKGSDCNC
ncbi:ras-related protein Rab-39B [Callorhinchus milii]|uniref:RAB42, member RAS oncogene family a n=1 Tax=Callorhinchus milii TaxID=7868 RepID=V9KRD7_CALMI|nr:ras-related protein Rab-39B [Callorhinchus milii]|eukprot:gi/632954582/ref/XP_007893039.1/ PREDICTED: ras-related protein Rab-39B-like [Callorhinchus milii]